MISLITGLPGSGKTKLLVHELMHRQDLKNRPLFVDGIPDLKIPTMEIPEGESMMTWHKWAPTGAVLVIGKAQRIFPFRKYGDRPECINELSFHTHKGICIFVITEHPSLIDANLRAFVGEHRHMDKTMLGLIFGFSKVSYWNYCANLEEKEHLRDAQISVFWKIGGKT